MIINVLVCQSDGSQVVEQREVPDNYFSVELETQEENLDNRSQG